MPTVETLLENARQCDVNAPLAEQSTDPRDASAAVANVDSTTYPSSQVKVHLAPVDPVHGDEEVLSLFGMMYCAQPTGSQT